MICIFNEKLNCKNLFSFKINWQMWFVEKLSQQCIFETTLTNFWPNQTKSNFNKISSTVKSIASSWKIISSSYLRLRFDFTIFIFSTDCSRVKNMKNGNFIINIYIYIYRFLFITFIKFINIVIIISTLILYKIVIHSYWLLWQNVFFCGFEGKKWRNYMESTV
jgi:hypothetical protein